MPLDHYVSQVHLKKFCSEELGGLMHAIRKSDLAHFTPRTRDVCRIEEGNTNEYLTEPRVIEEFLKTIEGRYNAAISLLEEGKPDRQAIYVIAGFASYVMTCSPAAMRINSEPLKGALEAAAHVLDMKGLMPPPPEELGGKNLTELLEGEKIAFNVDPKYPQAIGIANILQRAALFGNCHWEILLNNHNDCQFFTSDYPAGIESTQDPRVLNRIIPLTPRLAVRLQPDINRPPDTASFDFADFSFVKCKLARCEAVNINRILVRTAEDTVFFRDYQSWVPRFVDRNRNFRIETETIQIPQPEGILTWSRQAVAPFERG